MSKSAPAMSPSDVPAESLLAGLSGFRHADALRLLELHREVSGAEPVVWAGRILGFGEYTYRYDSGHGGTAPLLAFAPGTAKHTVYMPENFALRWPDAVASLGPHKASKVCLYFTRLEGVDLEVLRQLLQLSLADTIAAPTTVATSR